MTKEIIQEAKEYLSNNSAVIIINGGSTVAIKPNAYDIISNLLDIIEKQEAILARGKSIWDGFDKKKKWGYVIVMLIKILRTIIGLPFVLAFWPIAIAIALPLALIYLFMCLILAERVQDEGSDAFFLLLTLPYHYLKFVWR